MIAATTQPPVLDKLLTANWFDIVVIVMLVVGFYYGRKNGMSKEVLPSLQWLSVVIVSGWFYPVAAQSLVNIEPLSPLISYVLGYGILSLAVFFVFSFLKRTLGLRLFASNLFGDAEYYLGIPAGMVRFACILLFALSFLNARHFTPEEIKAHNDYEQQWYGSDFFPGLFTVQDQVFKQSLTGPYIEEYLGGLLIKPTPLHNSGSQPKQSPASIRRTTRTTP
ncbi:MAG: CvpA family protein [Verrucomicrobiota bacterium]